MRVIALLLAVTAPLRAQMSHLPAPKTDCAADGVVVNSLTGETVPRAHLMSVGSGASAAADNTGHWSLTGLACGRLQIMASRPGFLSRGIDDGITVTSDSPAHGVKIQLVPQSVVTGKVVDEAGDPVMNAQINVLCSRVVQGRRIFQVTSGSQSNDLGEFRIPNLTAGKFIFCAIARDLAISFVNNGSSMVEGETCYPGPVEGGAASAIDLPAGRETQVDFTIRQVPAVHVRGTVTGMPKNQGAAVTLQQRIPGRGPMNTRPANITPDGRFDVRGVTPGSYLLTTDYWEDGTRLTARVPVEVGSSDVEGVVVHLEQGLTMSGSVRVESATGKALPNQSWALNLVSSEPMKTSGGQLKWNADFSGFVIADMVAGNYRFEGTPPAPFYIRSAMLGGRDLTREEVPVTQSGQQLEVVLSDDSGSVEGTVEDSDGQPAPRISVMVLQDGRSPRTLMTGADGHFRIAGLAPGDYRIYAWDDASQVEYADEEWMKRQGGKGQTVTVQPGQTAGSVKLEVGQAAPLNTP